MSRKQFLEMIERLRSLGVSLDDALALRRIEMTLHRWSERECNGEVERDDETNKTYAISASYINGTGKYQRWPTSDRKTGALKRLEAIIAHYPALVAYHQGDPRGCALWIVCKSDIHTGEKLDAVYTRGIAVCE